jgi:hypothetical protein
VCPKRRECPGAAGRTAYTVGAVRDLQLGRIERRLVAGEILGLGLAVLAAWNLYDGWHAVGLVGLGLLAVCQQLLLARLAVQRPRW